MNRLKKALALIGFGVAMLSGFNTAHADTITSFKLAPVNGACLPDATGQVKVFGVEHRFGVDHLHLKVSGLPAHTDFAVFLTSNDAFTAPAFGTTEYIGDFTTDGDGKGSLKVRAIINEAFVSSVAGDPPARGSVRLDHLVFWFADPAQVPGCFNFTNPTPFDGNGSAGPAAMSSQGATGLELIP